MRGRRNERQREKWPGEVKMHIACFWVLGSRRIRSLLQSFWESFFEECQMISHDIRIYTIVRLEPLQNFFLQFQTLWKNLRSEIFIGQVDNGSRKAEIVKSAICSVRITSIWACNAIVEAIDKEYFASRFDVEFLKNGAEPQLNTLFVTRVVRGIVNWKNC